MHRMGQEERRAAFLELQHQADAGNAAMLASLVAYCYHRLAGAQAQAQ